MKETQQKVANKYVGRQKDHRSTVRHDGGMNRQLKPMRRKDMAYVASSPQMRCGVLSQPIKEK